MTKNEIVGRLKDGGLDASSTNRSAAVYVADAMAGRAVPGWFAYRIVCDSEATERRARAILSRWYDIDASGNVWRLRSKNRVQMMAIKRGATPPTPTDGPMYFEAVQANSTVSLMSTLATAPNLEYSTDGVTWQEWQHTTSDDTHTFDTLTLTAVGDRVYLRGDNQNGFFDLENERVSFFSMTGKIAAHGNAQSLVDGDTPTLVAKTMPFFSDSLITEQPNSVLVSAPSLPATTLTDMCYGGMFSNCTGLTKAPSLPATTLTFMCYGRMFSDCTFAMSSDGTTFNFEFGATPPVTAGETTYATAYDVAQWMGNTNGFIEP